MKKYIVVKRNLFRNQKFYKVSRKHDMWSVNKDEAYLYSFRKIVQGIVDKKNATLSDNWKEIL